MTLPDAASPDPSADHLMTRCPTCSAQLAYVPGTTSLQCGSCGTNLVFEEADIAAGQAYDAWAAEHAAGAATRPATVTMQCEGCGALTDSDSVATTCQFCASHLVALSAAPGMVMPDAVLPFVEGLVPLAVVTILLGTRLGLDPVSNAYIIAVMPPAVRGMAWGFFRTLFFFLAATGSPSTS